MLNKNRNNTVSANCIKKQINCKKIWLTLYQTTKSGLCGKELSGCRYLFMNCG